MLHLYQFVCIKGISEKNKQTNKQTKNKTKQNKNLHVSLARSNYIVIKCRVGGGGVGYIMMIAWRKHKLYFDGQGGSRKSV